MAAASPKPKGGAKLTKNKYVIAGVIVVAGALFYFYYKNKNATSSAGSSSTPQDATTGAGLTPSDSTGGGSGSGPDLSGLFNLLASDNSLIAQLAGNGGSGAVAAPRTRTEAVASNDTQFRGGGNTAPSTTATQPSQPTTSTPTLPQVYASITNTGAAALQESSFPTVLNPNPTSADPVGRVLPASPQTANDLNDVFYSPPLVTLPTTKPPPAKPKPAPAKPKSGYAQSSGANLH